jgi:uncharacterized protein YjbJ (UPF0337 family)
VVLPANPMPSQQHPTLEWFKGDWMNGDKVKGVLQKVGGHVEEAAGALVGDEGLKAAGQEDQIKGEAREAWGNVKDAGEALVDRTRVAKADAEVKAERAKAFDREHEVVVTNPIPRNSGEAKPPEKASEQGGAEKASGESPNEGKKQAS